MSTVPGPASGVSARPARRRLIIIVAAIVVALDAATKVAADHFLAHRGVVHLGGVLDLELYRNHAGPRNTLRGHPVLVSVVAIVAVGAIAVVATRVRTRSSAIAVGLLLGGGAGNVLDRLIHAPGPLRGGVIDWLRPAWSSGSMNLADLSITAAIVVALIAAARSWTGDKGGAGGLAEGVRGQPSAPAP
jgi:signal peptidase II